MKVTAGLTLRKLNGQFAPATFAAVLLQARQRIRADIEIAFDTKKDPQTGTPWKPRQARGIYSYLHPLLVKTGKLKEEALNAAVAAIITGNTLRVVCRKPDYAGFHQLGTRKMPRRPFLGITRATRLWLARRVKDEAVRVFRQRSRGSYEQ